MFQERHLTDPKGVLRQITMNELPVGRSVDEALCLVQAFQFTVSDLNRTLVGWVMLTRYGADEGRALRSMFRELEGGGKTIRGDPIVKLDYFAVVDGQHEKGKANGTKYVRVD